MRTVTATTLLAVLWSLDLFGQQETLDELAARAARDPTNVELVTKTVGIASLGKINPAAIPGLRELFTVLTEKPPRQKLALALLLAGQKDALYFGRKLT